MQRSPISDRIPYLIKSVWASKNPLKCR